MDGPSESVGTSATTARLLVLAPLVASLFSLWRASHIDPRFLPDDAYITLTFAKNLARGAGFVYNGGTPVLGTTTPLFTALVAGLSRLIPSAPLAVIAVLLSGFGLQALIWLPWLGRRDLDLADEEAAIVSVLLGATGAVAYLGMETYLLCALLVLAFALFERGAVLASGICAGLLFLTRGEGALAFVLLLGRAALQDLKRGRAPGSTQRRADSVRVCAGFSVPFLAWSLYAMRTFGGILPNTLAAKIAQGSSGLWTTFAAELTSTWLPAWCRDAGIPGLPWLGAWPILVLVGSFAIFREKRALTLLLLWCVLYGAGYSALGVSSYGWYAIPLYTGMTVAAGVGLGRWAAWTSRLPGPKPLRAAAMIGTVALVAFSLSGHSAPPEPGADVFRRGTAYLNLAGWIRGNVDAASSVAFHEIGYLGFYTENRIVDVVGLIHEDVAPYIVDQDFVTGFFRHDPDYLVFPEKSRFIGMIVASPRFRETYSPVARLPGADSGESLTIFRRRRRGAGPT